MDEGQKTPEQIAAEAEAKVKELAAKKALAGEFQIAINSAPSNANVLILLKGLMKMSGYDSPSQVVGANGELQISSTVFNVGREAVYHDIRRLMSVETKNAVERSE